MARENGLGSLGQHPSLQSKFAFVSCGFWLTGICPPMAITRKKKTILLIGGTERQINFSGYFWGFVGCQLLLIFYTLTTAIENSKGYYRPMAFNLFKMECQILCFRWHFWCEQCPPNLCGAGGLLCSFSLCVCW